MRSTYPVVRESRASPTQPREPRRLRRRRSQEPQSTSRSMPTETVLQFFATNNAGVSEAPHGVTISLDKTLPTDLFRKPGCLRVLDTVNITCTASDSLAKAKGQRENCLRYSLLPFRSASTMRCFYHIPERKHPGATAYRTWVTEPHSTIQPAAAQHLAGLTYGTCFTATGGLEMVNRIIIVGAVIAAMLCGWGHSRSPIGP